MRVAFWLLQDSLRHWRRWVAGLYYVRHCLAALAALPRDEVPPAVAFVPQSLDQPLWDEHDGCDPPWLSRVGVPEALLEQPSRRELAALVSSHSFDVLFPALTPPCVPVAARTIGWIADCQHCHYPQFFSPEERTYRDALFRFLIGSSDRLVCSSEAVRHDLRRFYGDLQGRERVVRFAVSPPRDVLAVPPTEALARLRVATPYAYLPNQFWVHKNHRLAFEAWRILWSRGRRLRLVCSGATDDPRAIGHFAALQEFLTRHNLHDAVQILGLVERRDQWQLFRGAAVVLQPSLFEGWSTSIEEAKSLGKPLIVSDIPTHREQTPAARFFSPTDAESLAQAVDESWRNLAPETNTGHDAAAGAACEQRMRRFGRELVHLFADAHADASPPRAPHLLPLLLHAETTARERLSLIDQLSAEAEARLQLIHLLQAAADERLRLVDELDRACRERDRQIESLRLRLSQPRDSRVA